MKKRDVIGLVIAIAIFSIAGVILYTQFVPASTGTGISVEVPAKVVVPLAEEKDRAIATELERYADYSVPQKCKDQGDVCGGGENPI